METKGIILDLNGQQDFAGKFWSHIVQDAWNKCGVVADDALFREAYVYGEEELKRTLDILPHHNFSELLNFKIQIELQYLAQNGHFPPAQVEPKAQDITKFCYGVIKGEIDNIREILKQLSVKYKLAIIPCSHLNLYAILNDLGISEYFVKEAGKNDEKSGLETQMANLGFKPDELLVIGEDKNTISEAKKLGCLAIPANDMDSENTPLSQEEIIAIHLLISTLNPL